MINTLVHAAQVVPQEHQGEMFGFSDKDLQYVVLPHNDPLIIHINYKGTTVKRVVVDNVADVNVMYMNAFRALGLEKSMLHQPDSTLQTFNSQAADYLGTIVLPISVGNPKDGYVTSDELFWVPEEWK